MHHHDITVVTLHDTTTDPTTIVANIFYAQTPTMFLAGLAVRALRTG